MSYRLIYVGLGLLVVAVVAFGVALSDSGEPVTMPEPVEAVYPQPGDLVPIQTRLEVDMKVGYSAAIFVDGWLVQDVNFIEGTGVHSWEPSPSNPTINEWSPGEHTIRIEYNTVNGLPDVGEFEWTFRIG